MFKSTGRIKALLLRPNIVYIGDAFGDAWAMLRKAAAAAAIEDVAINIWLYQLCHLQREREEFEAPHRNRSAAIEKAISLPLRRSLFYCGCRNRKEIAFSIVALFNCCAPH